MIKYIKTNLRWAGGKSKMTKIIDNFLPENINKYLEVFTGGGSVLLYIIQKYNPQIVYANDIDENLINYYKSIRDSHQSIINECLEIKNSYNKETFSTEFHNLDTSKASHFFVANKTSFSGLNRTYSSMAYDKNFSVNSINKIKDISSVIRNVKFLNCDFINLDDNINDIDDYFIYLYPPYFDNKNKGLYGEKGNLHKKFNHIDLFNWIKNHASNNKIMLSYDDSPYIKDLYKDFNIYGFDFVYSMTNVGGKSCKSGKEIIITNY